MINVKKFDIDTLCNELSTFLNHTKNTKSNKITFCISSDYPEVEIYPQLMKPSFTDSPQLMSCNSNVISLAVNKYINKLLSDESVSQMCDCAESYIKNANGNCTESEITSNRKFSVRITKIKVMPARINITYKIYMCVDDMLINIPYQDERNFII